MMVFVLLSRMFRRAVVAVAATVLPLLQLSVIAAMVPVRCGRRSRGVERL